MTEDDFDWLILTFQGHSVNIQLTKWPSFILSYLTLLIGPIFFVCQYIDHKLLTHTFYKIYKFYTWISWKYVLPYGTWEFFQCHTLQAEGHLVFCCLYPLEEAPLKIKSKIQVKSMHDHYIQFIIIIRETKPIIFKTPRAVSLVSLQSMEYFNTLYMYMLYIFL